MKTVKIFDKQFSPFIESERILNAVNVIADALNKEYVDKNPLFIGVLNGSFIFAGDLFKQLKFQCEISFVKLSSYSGLSSSGEVCNLIGLTQDISGREVIILEDIVDTGLTLEKLRLELLKSNPASLKIATLLFKPEAFKASYKIDYMGFSIPNDFIVGYGLDYNGYGRNFPDIYKII